MDLQGARDTIPHRYTNSMLLYHLSRPTLHNFSARMGKLVECMLKQHWYCTVIPEFDIREVWPACLR